MGTSIPLLVSLTLRPTESVYIFLEVAVRSKKSFAIENERLFKSSKRQTTEGTKLEQYLTNQRFTRHPSSFLRKLLCKYEI